MKNNFSLSFALALLITGIFCLFFDVDDIIMFGVSFSSFIFSGISIFLSFTNKKKYELAYAFPFIILLCFCCYGDSLMKNEEIKEMVSSGMSNAITFFSFGTIFLAENISKIKERKLENKRNEKIIVENLNYSEQILGLTMNYMNSFEKRKMIPDENSKKFISKIVDLSQEKIRQSQINNDLLKLEKSKFDFDDINKVFIDSSNVINIKDNKNNH